MCTKAVEWIDVDNSELQMSTDSVAGEEATGDKRPQRKRKAPDFYHAPSSTSHSVPDHSWSRSTSSGSNLAQNGSFQRPCKRGREEDDSQENIPELTQEGILRYNVKELRSALKRTGLGIRGCDTKEDLQRRLIDHLKSRQTASGTVQSSPQSTPMAVRAVRSSGAGAEPSSKDRSQSSAKASSSCADDERLAQQLFEEERKAVEKARAIQRRDEALAQEIMRQLQDDEVSGTSVDAERASSKRGKHRSAASSSSWSWEEDERLARRLYEEERKAMEKARAIERRDEALAQEIMRQLQDEDKVRASAQLEGDLEIARKLQEEEDACQKSCRFCSSVVLIPASKASLAVSCDSQECKGKAQAFCDKMLPCGHPCSGMKNEASCSVCAICAGEDEKCPICWDAFGESPCLRLGCKHVMHYGCLVSQIKSVNWKGKKIAFRALQCAGGCGNVISHPSLAPLMKNIDGLHKKMVSNALLRAQQDKLCTAKKPLPPQELLQKYHYYQCYQCGEPYCGGRADLAACREAVAADAEAKDAVCPGCTSAGTMKCVKHGTSFLGYKCYYCCGSAVFFCFGTRHFCDDCHRISATCKPKACVKGKCPLQGRHPPNPSEYAMGCALCHDSS